MEAQELMEYAQNLMNWLTDVIGHHDGLLNVHHHADGTEDKLQHDFINILAPRYINGCDGPTSAWQLACSMYEDRIGSLTGVALALMVRLVRMVGKEEATREELDGHFKQLVGNNIANNIALSLFAANAHTAFKFVAHAKKFSPEWWDTELRKQLSELPTAPQRPDTKARGANNQSEPAQFVRDIEAASVCDDLIETQHTSASGDQTRFGFLLGQAQAIFSLGLIKDRGARGRPGSTNEVDIEAGQGREAESSPPGGEMVAGQA
ncbi:hypothetical protein BKA62DRAFT_835837 [Auriculariales sp. MPI-PUGE-AT-0066]|nr:hypothetical protein BKA62DRAFT_835837 [Auriculariales sp. MPI-PUGE-AT-0066]